MAEGSTHDGVGRPRLVMSLGGSVELPAGSGPVVQPEFALVADRVRIGGGPGADLRLDGLDDLHAEIWHDEHDQYVVVDRARERATRVDGDPVVERALYSGDRIQLGPYVLVFVRGEPADRPRPDRRRKGRRAGR